MGHGPSPAALLGKPPASQVSSGRTISNDITWVIFASFTNILPWTALVSAAPILRTKSCHFTVVGFFFFLARLFAFALPVIYFLPSLLIPHICFARKPKMTQRNKYSAAYPTKHSTDNTELRKVMRKKTSNTSIKRHFIKVIKRLI